MHVQPIDPRKYPELESNPENPFSSMDADKRMQEIVSFCAQLWARTCDDATRKAKAA